MTSESPEGDVIVACSCKNPTTALTKPYQRAVGVRRRAVAMFAVDRLVTSWDYRIGFGAKWKDGWYRAAVRTDKERFRVHGRDFAKTDRGWFCGAFFHLVFMVFPLVFVAYWLVLCSS